MTPSPQLERRSSRVDSQLGLDELGERTRPGACLAAGRNTVQRSTGGSDQSSSTVSISP